MKKAFATAAFFVAFSLYSQQVFADNSILINEFQIEAEPQAVEIINTSSASASLSHWYIDDNGGTTFYTIPDNTFIYANSCLVFTGDFNLNKSSADAVRLFDSTAPPTAPDAKLIDSFAYKSSSGSAVTYQRQSETKSWIAAAPSIGKYNGTDTACVILPTATPTLIPTPTPTPTPLPEPTSSQTSYDHLYISEVMVYPNSGDNEWVELYNDNDFTVKLDKWYLDDGENTGSSPKQFSLTIAGKGYAVFDLSTGMYNNDDDAVRLLDFAKAFKDGFEYSTPQRGLSLGRTNWETDSFCNQEPSKGIQNNTCKLTITPTAKPTIKPTAKPALTTASKSSPKTQTATLPLASDTTDTLPATNVSEPVGEVKAVAITETQPADPPQINRNAFVRSTSFASFGLSLLSAISVIIKLRAKIIDA